MHGTNVKKREKPCYKPHNCNGLLLVHVLALLNIRALSELYETVLLLGTTETLLQLFKIPLRTSMDCNECLESYKFNNLLH